MLFNSYPFLFGFLPLTLAVFFWLGRSSRRLAAAWLALASVAFYAWWSPLHVLLLGASVVTNFAFGTALAAAAARGERPRLRLLLALGVGADLALLAYFKYSDFLIGSVNLAFGAHVPLLGVVLPLGISFFTFTQIAFLVDASRGEVHEPNFIHYALFVTYFPHLIAGPVLHHKEMMPQFGEARNYRPSAENFAVGLSIFAIGLFKKTVLADGIAPYANHAFAAAAGGEPLGLVDAWGGVLAYTLQLYFDFSGYSDMAIGLSRLFGVRLPLNFDSPYKAVNIVDFWRRWHMTLSRFLRDYLYFALGGNRKGPSRRYANLMITMLLGGLWHGAAWHYVAWGALHGAYLVVNHAWQRLRTACGLDRIPSSPATRALAWTLTFVAVVVGWAFFRAADLASAVRLVSAMFAGEVALPSGVALAVPGLSPIAAALGVKLTLGGGAWFVQTWAWIVALLAVARFWPNTQELMARFEPALDFRADGRAPRLAWHPTPRWALALGGVSVLALFSLHRVSEFLYFQF